MSPDKKLASVLAGLRMLQHCIETDRISRSDHIEYDEIFDETGLPTPAEIEELCQSINHEGSLLCLL